MDSVTHLALGAVVGEAMLGKKLGKKILLIGAAAQFLPDADVAASLWLPPAENLLMHRGITHSLLFCALATVLLSFLASRFQKQKSVSTLTWVFFFGLQLCIHLFIDAFNAYGVGWFEPFSQVRISFNTLFVVDPFFTIPITIACICLLVTPTINYKLRHRFVIVSLFVTTCYLLYAIWNKVNINQEIQSEIQYQTLTPQQYFTTPTPFNSLLWYVVVKGEKGFYTGYFSVFDSKNKLELTYFPQQDSLLSQIKDTSTLRSLQRFSKGYYTVEYLNEQLIFNDLRFGQIAGWQNPTAPFVFHFFLQNPKENTMVMQRGRLEGWNNVSFKSMIERIKGV